MSSGTSKENSMTEKIAHPAQPAKQPRPVKPVENTTDASRGEPLAMRAQKRKLELEKALEKVPAGDMRSRNDIDVALATINALLTGDVDRLSDTTAAELSRVLENSKHLAEITPTKR
jgi:hypothetical protein